MNERGSHMVQVSIGLDTVNIDSELRYENPTRPVERGTDTFNSIEEAKKKLDSIRKLYQMFEAGYRLLGVGELGLFLGSIGKGITDLSHGGGDFGVDLLRALGVIGIGLLTITAEVTAGDNKVKTVNKLTAVEKAEEKNVRHFHEIYPFF